MARFAGVIDERTQDFENSSIAYTVDALGISIGSLMGSPPVTAYIESGAGISEGGKTGLTAIVSGLAFFISIFFAPIFASIPPWATGCTLIIIGALMAQSAKDVNWRYVGDAIPAFLTIAIMPFTYSIAYGLIAGIVSYMVINTLVFIVEKASGGRIVPPNKSEKEPWTWRIPGGIMPPWMQRITSGKKDFWREHDEVDGVQETERQSESSSAVHTANEKTSVPFDKQGDHIAPYEEAAPKKLE
jgi:AGZA family xanthine/uracil permease-like MFS transporter